MQKINLTKAEIRYAQLLETVFNTEKGRELRDLWKDAFLCAPGCPPKDQEKDAPSYYIYVREGENKFIRHIDSAIKKYEIFKQQQRGNNE